MKKIIIKKYITIITLLFSCNFLFGKVTFNLNFSDPEGMGFKAQHNRWMMKVAQEAVEMIGDIIEQDAHVNIEIKSNFQIKCAMAVPMYWRIEQEKTGEKAILEAHHKILKENKIDDGKMHGHIEFNPNGFNRINSTFFRRTIIHELTHSLGFIPWKLDHNHYPSYNDYDKLMHDDNGNSFLIGKGKLEINPKFNCNSGLYAIGHQIKKLNDEKSIKIYCPKKYERGASYAHLDFEAHPSSIMNPRGGPRDYPIWNKWELGIMLDLGYKIDWSKYNSIIAKFFPTLSYLQINQSKKA